MTYQSKYYTKVLEKISSILNDSKGNPYITRYCINKNETDNSYRIDCAGQITLNSQKSYLALEKDFVNNLMEHLNNDKPFKLKYSKNEDLLNHFFEKVSSHFYVINDIRHYSQPNNFIIPTIEEFEKLIKCFEPTLTTIKPFVRAIPIHRKEDKHPYLDFIDVVMSLHNDNFYLNKSDVQIKKIIRDELSSLTSQFYAENEPAIAQGIKSYLSKKTKLLEKINDKNFEIELYEVIKNIIHSDLWSDVALFLPSFSNKNKKIDNQNIFLAPNNQIFHVNLNKEAIFNISSSIIIDKDLEETIKIINLAINKSKPKDIDLIQAINSNGNFKLIMSGLDMDNDKISKLCNLFQDMIYEYNSDNVSKKGSISKDEIENNEKYLAVFAETLWLNFELRKNNEKQANKTHKL
jgi:hypothetical protein